jgi:hypothetical protein
VEVYKARELTPTTSTGGWKNWAKTTSGMDPATRAPTLVAPVAVTSTDGWRSFATAQSGVEPEKPMQRTETQSKDNVPAIMEHSAEPKLIASTQSWPNFPKSEPTKAGSTEGLDIKKEEQTKHLPPHLRKPEPAIKSESIKPIQNIPTPVTHQEETLPPHLRKIEPATKSEAVRRVQSFPERVANQYKPTQSGSAPNIQPTAAVYDLPATEPQKPASSVSKATESPGAWQAFAGIKSAADMKVTEKAPPAVNNSAPNVSQTDPAIFNAIIADLSSIATKKAEPVPDVPQPVKQSESGQPQRGSKHFPTNSEFERLATTLEGLKLEHGEAQHSLDFFTTEPPAAKPKPMATSLESLKSAPGLSASKWA